MSAEMFKAMTRTDLLHVPYRGAAPAIADLLGGQRIDDPAPDLAMLARAQGLTAFGPVRGLDQLDGALAEAVRAVRAGAGVVVDVHVRPGYGAAMAQGMTRTH